MTEGVKIYGLCLERIRHQTLKAETRLREATGICPARYLLESYNTGNVEEIIDILELYDVDERTREGVDLKLEDLAWTVSLLVKKTLVFGYTGNGHLGLYYVPASMVSAKEEEGQEPAELEAVHS